MKFAANLSYLWQELPYLDRFEAAAEAGFDGVEVLFPYDMPAKETQRALMRSGLPLVLIAAPPPNYTGGGRGFAAVPGSEGRFRYDLRRALRYCDALRVPMLQVLTGVAEGDAARRTLVQNMRWASEALPQNVLLTLQPVNADDTPGCFLDNYDLAADVVREIDAANVGLQFDSYEAQVIHGDAPGVFEKHRALIRHVQMADAPGRGGPGSGSIDFDALFAVCRTTAYEGWISANYTPASQTEGTLAWIHERAEGPGVA